MTGPRFTPKVLKLVGEIEKLTTGELVALNEALAGRWTLPPAPDSGVREPAHPKPPHLQGGATADEP